MLPCLSVPPLISPEVDSTGHRCSEAGQEHRVGRGVVPVPAVHAEVSLGAAAPCTSYSLESMSFCRARDEDGSNRALFTRMHQVCQSWVESHGKVWYPSLMSEGSQGLDASWSWSEKVVASQEF